jgi:hypothetical protein
MRSFVVLVIACRESLVERHCQLGCTYLRRRSLSESLLLERSINKLEVAVPTDERAASKLLTWVLAAGILSTAIHYTHNFIAANRYPGPGGGSYTFVRVAIVVAWPLLTAIGLLGYRRYRERRYREARVALATYSLTGISTAGHFLYGNPNIPAFFYATLFTDVLTGLSVLAFLAWSARAIEPRLLGARA